MELVIEHSAKYLRLQKPWDIGLKYKLKSGNAAEYLPVYKKSGRIKNHRILINCSNLPFDRRSIECLIAHEFIHAWQEETNNWQRGVHGVIFQKQAMFLQEYLKLQSIDTGPLYLRGIDK